MSNELQLAQSASLKDAQAQPQPDHRSSLKAASVVQLGQSPSLSDNFTTPSFASDAVLFRMINNVLHVALIGVTKDPYKGKLGFPGGKFDPEKDNTMKDTCLRELREETGLTSFYSELLGIYGASPYSKYRDARKWMISHVFIVYVTSHDGVAGDDAGSFGWYDIDSLDESVMAYDHWSILQDAINKVDSSLFDGSVTFTYMRNARQMATKEDIQQEILRRIDRDGYVSDSRVIEKTLGVDRQAVEEVLLSLEQHCFVMLMVKTEERMELTVRGDVMLAIGVSPEFSLRADLVKNGPRLLDDIDKGVLAEAMNAKLVEIDKASGQVYACSRGDAKVQDDTITLLRRISRGEVSASERYRSAKGALGRNLCTVRKAKHFAVARGEKFDAAGPSKKP